MPKTGSTDITIVLDRSGSMQDTASDTIGGFNKFLADQKAIPGECRLTMVQFDHEYQFLHQGQPIAEVPPLTKHTFCPRGRTALLDAMGRAINETGTRLSAMAETDRPEHVVFVVITDGLENASHEFRHSQIMEMVKRQTETFNWHFVYLGANQDAIQVGAALGVPTSNVLNAVQNTAGIGAYYGGLTANVGALRQGLVRGMGFTPEQRAEQEKAGAKS